MALKTNRIAILALLLAWAWGNGGLGSTAGAAELDLDLGVEGRQFAQEKEATARIDTTLGLRSEEALDRVSERLDSLARRSKSLRYVRLNAFYEPGKLGDRSIDPDPMVWRLQATSLLPGPTHLWIGRTHPYLEASDLGQVESTSALGASWVQNQSDPLQPRVSGWLGTGFTFRPSLDGVHATVAYSPVFLPSFGPRLDLSENTQASGSRYARLPPQYFRLNGVLVPLRFKVNTGDIKDIVLQDQAWASVGYSEAAWGIQAFAWSAPSPDPQVDTTGKLRVSSSAQDAQVLVTAKPRFPREKFLGAEWRVQGVFPKPSLQMAYETVSRRWVGSAALEPVRFFRTGMLHTWLQPKGAAELGGEGVESPRYAQRLLWGQLDSDTAFYRWVQGLEASLRWEEQLEQGLEGRWVSARVQFEPQRRLQLYAMASVISGRDFSYFGTWRALDSVSLGARWIW